MPRIFILVVLALVFLVGCTQPIAKRSVPAVDVIVEDSRAEKYDQAMTNDQVFFLAACPLLPYFNNRENFYSTYNFAPELTKAVKSSQIFANVYSSDEPDDRRREAPLELRVTLGFARYGEATTSYALGVGGFPLYLIGFPMRYSKANVEITVECIRREDGTTCQGSATASDIGAIWLFSGSTSPGMREINDVIHEAFYEAFADCLDDMRDKGVVQ